MDLWQLNIFCKVVELKSFSRAGETVHISQPTVSSHIKDLEDHFGGRLIDRLGREAAPTGAGELLYSYARKIIALRDETETALAEFHGRIKGRLVIGGSTIPGVHILPRVIGAFIKMYPEATISLVIADTEKIITSVLSGEVELGVVGAGSAEKKIYQEKLIEDEMRLIVPAGHKWAKRKSVDIRMLRDEPFILRECGSGTLKSIKGSLASAGHDADDLNIVAEIGSTEAVAQGIKSKIGISILSTIAVSEDLRAGKLKALSVEGLDLRRSFHLTRLKNRTASPLAREFTTFLNNEFMT